MNNYSKKMENYILVSWLDKTHLCSKTVIMAILLTQKVQMKPPVYFVIG